MSFKEARVRGREYLAQMAGDNAVGRWDDYFIVNLIKFVIPKYRKIKNFKDHKNRGSHIYEYDFYAFKAQDYQKIEKVMDILIFKLQEEFEREWSEPYLREFHHPQKYELFVQDLIETGNMFAENVDRIQDGENGYMLFGR